jgi:oxygen-independent coproporphyrinogen-3 oxidase
MGYTHSAPGTIVGLGCSSISESSAGFAQNEPNVEDYIAAVLAGNFAIIKGHLHTETDRIIGKHITEIMCMGYTHFTITEVCEPWFWPFMQRTKFLENDGFISWDSISNTLSISKDCNVFARLVAFQVDLRYWDSNTQISQRFSKAV